MHRHVRLTLLASLLAAAPLVAVTSVASASTPVDGSAPAPAPEGVTLIDAGDADGRVMLPGTPTVGMAGRVTTVSATTGSIVLTGVDEEGATIDVVTTYSQSGEITSVADDGSFVMDRLVESYDVVDRSENADGSSYTDKPELEALVGVGPLPFSYSATAQLLEISIPKDVTLDAAQQASIDELLSDSQSTRFPAEPVGRGAEWHAELVSDNGDVIPATYTLTELEGSEFAIEVVMELDASAFLPDPLPAGFTDGTGTVRATGRFAGTVGNPFTQLATTDLTIELVLSGPGYSAEMTIVEHEEQTAG